MTDTILEQPLINNNKNERELPNFLENDETHMHQTYWYRWYILIVFCLFAFVQTAVANTWGPISVSAKAALQFTDHDIELFVSLPSVVMLISMPFFIYLLDWKGLRVSLLISSFCVFLGTGLSCIPFLNHNFNIIAHAALCLNGIASSMVLGAPPLLSNIWFPPNERVTATSFMVLLGSMGSVYSSFVESAIVHSPTNSTNSSETSSQGIVKTYVTNITNTTTIRAEISLVLYIYCGMAAIVFASMLVFYPSKPPRPPSSSAHTTRLSFRNSIKYLLKIKSYWAINLTQACIVGAFFSWTGIFADLYSKYGITQVTSGYVLATMNLTGVLAGLLIGWYIDRFKGKIKVIISILLVIIFLSFLFLVTSTMEWIKSVPFVFTNVTLWVCCVLIGTAVNAFLPLIIEIAVDHAYPVSEGMSNLIMMWFSMLAITGYITILSNSNGQTIANYLLLVFTGVAVPTFTILVPQKNIRLAIDLTN